MSTDVSLSRTPLYDWHQAAGGRLVEFGGWSMPVQYTTIIDEHKAIRERVGLFDISHMGRLTFDGPGVLDWLERVTTNCVTQLADLQIQYSLLATDSGGVIDDVLVYKQPFAYIVVCNASNRAAVKARFDELRDGAEGTFVDRTIETAMIAIQGPHALATLQPLFDQPLDRVAYYHLSMGRLMGTSNAVVSRTGYTGEDGFEIIVAGRNALELWNALLESGRKYQIQACGLGARDTLRLEAGMPLYGHELGESINPYAAGVGWAVKLGKGPFAGSAALAAKKSNPGSMRVGLNLASKRIARQGARVLCDGKAVGEVTSGTYSPTLQISLAMAFVTPAAAAVGTQLAVDVRGHHEPAQVVNLPFYKRHQPSAPTGGPSSPRIRSSSSSKSIK